MKPLVLVVGVAWILTLGAAYLIGQKSTPGAGAERDEQAAAASSRSASPSAKSARPGGRAAGNPRSAPRGTRGKEAGRIVAGTPPRQAVVELAQLSDPVERAKGFLALIDSLEAGDFREVLNDFRALGITEQRMSEYGMLLHAWGQTEPARALEWAMKNTGTPFARQTILASWAADDPDAATAFARENYKGENANPLLVGVIRGLAPLDLNRATGLLQELPYSRERGDALQSLLPFVMENGVEVALNWTNGIADERLKSGAITYIMSDLSEREPEVAAKVLVDLADNSAAIRVADDVGGSLARQSLERAIEWSESLQPDLRAEAVEGVVGHYASQDPEAASQWLESLADTTNLDAAINRFAWTAQHKNPQLAADWIGQIQGEDRRNEVYRGVLSRWWSSDAAAAEEWIQSAPDLPDAIRQLPARLQQDRAARDSRRSR